MSLRVLALVLAGCAGPASSLPSECEPGGAVPATIAEVMERIDALPAPTTLPCIVASLPRPLALEATSDVFSAQPAVGERSPRMFVQYPGLTLTIAPEGPGAAVLEFGEAAADGLTIKAEIALPLDGPVEPMAPYDRVAEVDGTGTTCGVCHSGEVEVEPGVFASIPFRPHPELLVPVSRVRAEAEACGEATDDRCALLRAVFEHGEVFHAPFPDDLPTIYGAP